MQWNRREVLASLGVGAAHLLLGCTAPPRGPARPMVDADEVRTWLHEAVARLHAAGFTHARALAVTRHRTSAALDVMGAGVSHAQTDGVILSTGTAEHVVGDLSRAALDAAVRALAGSLRPPARVDFGPPPPAMLSPRELADHELLDRVSRLAARDDELSSRIVYSAALVEVDEAHIWAVGAGFDRQQRITRVRKSLTRVAWNGTRPVVSEVARAWAGTVDDLDLSDVDVAAAREHALALMTPAAFPDGDHAVTLDPSLVAALMDTAARTLLTTTAAQQPEVARRLAIGRQFAAPLLTLLDDPLAPAAYGGYAFDDLGDAATARTLVDKGQVTALLEPRRRPGHLGPLEAAPSHLRVVPGTVGSDALLVDGFELEGAISALVDPTSDHVVITAARARERKAKTRTGRIYADVELTGELTAILAAITGISADAETFGTRDDIDGRPCFRSITTPALRTRGTLRARRRT